MFEKYPRIEMPETINIDSANKLITNLENRDDLSVEDREEVLEMKKNLIQLQNDLSDGELKSPLELQIAILKLNEILEGNN